MKQLLSASTLALTIVVLALASEPVSAVAQRTLHVPADASTVQGAIGFASDGDTVSLAPGTYVGAINFTGKQITVQGSAPGVILMGNGSGPVVTFNSGETRAAVLQGVTVTGGAAVNTPSSGGIFIDGASPTLQNTVVQNNVACGITVLYGAPLLLNNVVSGTVLGSQGCLPSPGAVVGAGGGILLYGASNDGLQPQLIGNTVENNHSKFTSAGGNGSSSTPSTIPG